jgi:hypothetical protein
MEQGTSDNKDNKRLTSEELMQAVGGSREDPAERQSWFICKICGRNLEECL